MRRPKEYNKHKKESCVACGHTGSFFPLDIDHVKTIGSGGTNDAYNCMTLCRSCHILKGRQGLKYMADTYSGVYRFLTSNNWAICQLTGKWRHDE